MAAAQLHTYDEAQQLDAMQGLRGPCKKLCQELNFTTSMQYHSK